MIRMAREPKEKSNQTEPGAPGIAKVRATLIDPQTMLVVWANEAAAEGADGFCAGLSAERVIPLRASDEVASAIRSVAEKGAPRHFHADVISTGQGSMALVTSVYRLPDGHVLVLTEDAWRPKPRVPGTGTTGGAAQRRKR